MLNASTIERSVISIGDERPSPAMTIRVVSPFADTANGKSAITLAKIAWAVLIIDPPRQDSRRQRVDRSLQAR
jgi:hypothetical protein